MAFLDGLLKKKDNNEVEDIDVTESMEVEDEMIEERDMLSNDEEEVVDRTVEELIDDVIENFTQIDPIKLNMLERGKLRRDIFEEDVKHYISKITSDKNKQEKVFKGFASFVWSYDILDELIEDRDISDIKIYHENNIRIKVKGKRKKSDLQFRSRQHYLKFVEHVAIKNKVSISDQNALQAFTDKTSSDSAILRFNIATGFVTSSGIPRLHIRKVPKIKYTEEELIKFGMFDKKTADYLKDKAKNGDGILFCGKGAAGKTTVMNFLIDEIPEDCSGMVIQDQEELHSTHPDMDFHHTVRNRGEGKIEYSLNELAVNGLLTDLDYFIIGEIKGSEAIYLLNAVYTGHKAWASVHGASSKEAMKKLVDYIKYNSDYSQEEALEMLVHLNTVVFMKDFKVAEISEVTGFNSETGELEYKTIL